MVNKRLTKSPSAATASCVAIAEPGAARLGWQPQGAALMDDWARGLDKKVIAQRLRALQQAVGVLTDTRGVSHARMGEWAGVSEAAWGHYFTGIRSISPHAAGALKI